MNIEQDMDAHVDGSDLFIQFLEMKQNCACNGVSSTCGWRVDVECKRKWVIAHRIINVSAGGIWSGSLPSML